MVTARWGLIPGEQPVLPRVRQRIIRAGCRLLFAQGALEEALFLNAQAAFDAQAAAFELRLVRLLGDSRRLADAVRRTGALIPRGWTTQVKLLELRLKLERSHWHERDQQVHKLLMLRPHHHRIFGALRSTVGEQLAALPVERFTNPTQEYLIGSLIALRGIQPAEQADFRRRFLWGGAAKLLLEYLAGITAETSRRIWMRQTKEALMAEGLRALDRQVRDGLVVAHSSALECVARQGRSIVAAHVHAGIGHVWTEVLDALELKTIVFAANGGASRHNPRIEMVSTSGNGAQFGFLKAAKAVRRGQHLVRIFPDGSAGGDRMHGTILGVAGSIGAGAGRLAWLAGAATFFLGSRWHDDGHLELYAIPGPVAESGIDSETFEKSFSDFYFGCLNGIADGPPENMGGFGGMWSALIRTGMHTIGDVA